jgi:hypothetical protein
MTQLLEPYFFLSFSSGSVWFAVVANPCMHLPLCKGGWMPESVVLSWMTGLYIWLRGARILARLGVYVAYIPLVGWPAGWGSRARG